MKCDEAKPACLRCTSTGRKCEGYATVSLKSDRAERAATKPGHEVDPKADFNAAPVSALSGSLGSASERRSLYMLRLATENDIARYYGASFWETLVLPVAEVHPSVRHSLLAVSALYEAYVKREHDSHRSQGVLDTPSSRSALLEYNKAIKILSDDLLHEKLPRQIVLICCILFVWLEFLRNDFVAGLRHLKSGMLILQESQPLWTSPAASSHVGSSIRHIFTRLQTQAVLHGCPQSDFNSTPFKCPTEIMATQLPQFFDDLAAFHYYLDSKLVYLFQFIRRKTAIERSENYTATAPSLELDLLIAERDSLLVDLDKWHKTLRHNRALAAPDEANLPVVLLLELNYGMAVMMMKNLFSETEMDYDQYTADFEHLLDLAESFLQHTSFKGSFPTLSIDMGVIPGLFYIALKCRDPTIRGKALDLLKQAPEREGIFHRDTILTAAAWKVAMESQWSGEQQGTDRPPEAARIYAERIRDATNDGEAATVRFEGGPEGSADVKWEIQGLFSRLGDVL